LLARTKKSARIAAESPGRAVCRMTRTIVSVRRTADKCPEIGGHFHLDSALAFPRSSDDGACGSDLRSKPTVPEEFVGTVARQDIGEKVRALSGSE
jgi:hypothetical protein